MKRKISLILPLIFLLINSSGQDFEVAPVLINCTEEPGSVTTRMLTIRNYSNSKQKFIFNQADFIPDRSGEKRSLPAGSSPNGIASWLTINPSFIELNPNETKQVGVVLTVPVNHFESRWGMIQVAVAREQTAQQADKQLKTGVVVLPRIVVLIKQEPKSVTNYAAKIDSLSEITKPEDAFRKFSVVIHNTGEKVIDASVYIAIADIKTAVEKKLKPEKLTVYPGFSRKIILTLPEKIAPGTYALAAILDYGQRKAIEGTQIMINQK